MRTFTRCLTVMTASFLLPSTIFGASLLYDGSVYPEQDGWTALGTPENPADYVRSLANGVLTIDATATGSATVRYEQNIQLTSDNVLYEWRSRTSNNDGYSWFQIFSSGSGSWSDISISWTSTGVVAYVSNSAVQDGYPRQVVSQIDDGAFHSFQVKAAGATYTLSIDGQDVDSAVLYAPTQLDTQVAWGFTKQMANVPARSEWDRVQVTEVPEPGLLTLATALLCAVVSFNRRR